MAKVTCLPGFVSELHGSLSKDSKYYFKTINGEVRMYEKPQRCPKQFKTQEQKNQRERFKDAQSAVKILCQNATLKKWVNGLWQPHSKKYSTLRGWLMAEMMRKH